MKSIQKTQRGISAIGLVIILAIIGAGAYIGLQYIPQYIEAGTVDSILANLEKAQEETPFSSAADVSKMINKQLTLNAMDDLRDSFKVTADGQAYIVRVSYERELNLIYEKKPMPYEKTITLQ
jgi:Tfp pilus assembly major pilin PilA